MNRSFGSIHRFLVGEYVSVREHDGIERPFKVADIYPVVVTRRT